MKSKSKVMFFHSSHGNISILLGKRVINSLEEFWWLPGGSVEKNEKIFEAALRELYEEFTPDEEMDELLTLYIRKNVTPPHIEFTTLTAHTTLFFIKTTRMTLPWIRDEFEELKWFPLISLPENMSREFVHLEKYMQPDFFMELESRFDYAKVL